MSGFCRGCLVKHDEIIELLQYTEKNRRLFLYSTSIQVKQNDTIKFQLCKDCYLSMKLACKFKKQCRNSDKLIKNYLALKEAGDNLDFSTYVKNKDASLTFRLPMIMGNSTPANQKVREDDNESTCTSIRNFITDIMHDEEIFDTEARIIHEVMREEPDVLDDSLDSHWLQDDASIDSDFRLDFSISPFSTPHSTNNDPYQYGTKLLPNKYHFYTPNVTTKSIENNLTQKKEDTVDITQSLVTGTENVLYSVSEEIEYMKVDKKLTMTNNEWSIKEVPKPNTSSDELLDVSTKLANGNIRNENTDNCVSFEMNIEKNEKLLCPIDRNLENALNNVNNNAFALSDILASSSPDFTGISPASTPRIREILYGDNCDISNQIDSYDKNKAFIENKTDNDQVDILEDFLKDQLHSKSLVENGTNKDHSKENEIHKMAEEQIRTKNLYCNMCQKKFKSVQGFKMHFVNTHQIKINYNRKSKQKTNLKLLRICDFCGTEHMDGHKFINHLKTHVQLKERKYNCAHCQLKFTSKSKLNMHMKTHGNMKELPDQKENQTPKKKFLCTYCGAGFKFMSNYQVHVRRHTKDYVVHCEICDKGFFRKFDVDIHMRQHTNERPFKCVHCPKSFKRHDILVMHAKRHFNEKNFICANCGTKFLVRHRLTEHLKRQICLKKKIDKLKDTLKTLNKSKKQSLLKDDLEKTEELSNIISCLEAVKTNVTPAEILDPEREKLIWSCKEKAAEAQKLNKSKNVKRSKRKVKAKKAQIRVVYKFPELEKLG